MSNTNQTTIVQGASGATDANFDNALSQGSAGPAALAQRTIYETMAMYLQIVNMDQKQKNNSLDIQNKAAQAQAKATIAAGDNQAQGLYWQGGLTIGGAVGSAAVNIGLQRSAYDDAVGNVKTAETKLEPLNNIDELQFKGATPAMAFGGKAPTADQIEASATRMKGGGFGTTAQEQADDATVMKVLRNTDEDNYLAVKKQLDTKISKLNEDRDAANKEIKNISTNRSTYSSMLSNLVQAPSNLFQGYYTAKKAKNDADAQLFQTTSSMASGISQTYDSQMSKMYDTALGALQALDKLRNSGQVN